MALSELEQRVMAAIEAQAEKITQWGDRLLDIPEAGYREYETAKLVQEAFESLSLTCETGLAVTGVRARAGSGTGPRICIIGELDGILCGEHPHANKVTGMSHACGHNAQLAAMLGAAVGLVKSGVLEELPGSVSFFAVPAEEYIDLDYKRGLREQGIIRYLGGKQELIARGEFDDVDMVMMVHAHPDTPEPTVFVHGGSLGFVEKRLRFLGKAVHASTPFEGVNALNAAALAILGMHANRERFRESDKIRVHPIITKGGDVVNTVPDEVCMDSYVRGATFDGILRASEDTDRAARGAAAMVGATVEIETQTGYFPLQQSWELGEVFRQVSEEFLPKERVISGVDMVGSSDIGDLSQLLPCIQPTVGGFAGALHSKEMTIADREAAYLLPAKIMALSTVRLLQNNAALGKEVIAKFQPVMTKESYLNRLDGSNNQSE